MTTERQLNKIPDLEVYRALSKRFESLRETQYKLPGIFSSIIGGLWYVASQHLNNDKPVAAAIFLFAALSGAACLNAMMRFRKAFNLYLDRLNALEGQHAISIRGGISTNRGMALLVGASVMFSISGCIYSFVN